VSDSSGIAVSCSTPSLGGWLAEMLGAMMPLAADYGRDVGRSVRRYTNNTNGGSVFVHVKDDKIIQITPIEFDEADAKSCDALLGMIATA
jgi:hypothetical protein